MSELITVLPSRTCHSHERPGKTLLDINIMARSVTNCHKTTASKTSVNVIITIIKMSLECYSSDYSEHSRRATVPISLLMRKKKEKKAFLFSFFLVCKAIL